MNSMEMIEILERKSDTFNYSYDISLEQFAISWSDLIAANDIDLLQLAKWCHQTFVRFKNDRKKTTACIFAMHTMKILLPRSTALHGIFPEIRNILRTLNESMTLYCFKDTNDNFNKEMIIVFYQIHRECSMVQDYLESLRTYNLWKPLICFYIEVDKFGFLIQNTCMEYANNLVSRIDDPLDLRMILEVIDLVASYIKDELENNNHNSGIIFRCLKLMDNVLSNHLVNLSCESFHVISRKCHSVATHVWLIANATAKDTITKHSLKVHVLLRIINTSKLDSILDQIVSIVDGLAEYEKFVPFVTDVLLMFDVLLKKTSVYEDYLKFLAIVQVQTCAAYFQYPDFSWSHSVTETKDIVPKLKEFPQIYSRKVAISSPLPVVVEGILQTVCDISSKWSTAVRLFFIDFLSMVLKNCHCERHKLDESYNIFLNVMYTISALLSTLNHLQSDQLSIEILRTAVHFVNVTDINYLRLRLAAFKLCHIVVKQKTELPTSSQEALKFAVTSCVCDAAWEIRDTALELINEILQSSPTGNYLTSDPVLLKNFVRTLTDEESFVRETSYTVLSNLVRIFCEQPENQYFRYENFETLASNTLQYFTSESDGSVREKMVTFVFHFWQRFTIRNDSLLRGIHRMMFVASTNDLHSEVRVAAMLFWVHFVEKVPRITDDFEIEKLFDVLSSVGCLQVIAGAINDEYDQEVKNLAFSALEKLEQFRLFFEDREAWHTNLSRESVSPPATDFDVLGNVLRGVSRCDLAPDFLRGKNFFKVCNKKCLVIPETDKNPKNTKSIDMEELLTNFVRISCNSKIDEKDCY